MNKLKLLFRFIYINYIFARYGFMEIVLVPFLKPLRFLVYINPWTWLRSKQQTRGERVRLMLTALGPIYVKFGQILSTRKDLIPDDIADELILLQDKVPPFPGEQAKAIIEKEYGCLLDKVFAEFDIEPLASASIAQVHAATLLTKEDVIVKVLRPGINKTIQQDIALMYIFARIAQYYSKDFRRLRPMEVVAEFEQQLQAELDLHREAANAAHLRENFKDSELLYVPEIYWDHTTTNVMVMERIYGIRISHVDELKNHGLDMKLLAERGVEIFFTQVFRDSFFHADMHPGNIFVDVKNPDNPRYIGVDFGIMGTLTSTDQRYLAENFVAFFNRDYNRIAELHVESGWVPAETKVHEFESVIRSVCEPIFEKPISEISFGKLLLRLFQTARQFNMEVQPQLMLLQKTLINIEGLGRDLYPQLNLWTTAKPFLEKWVAQRVGVRALASKVAHYFPHWIEKFPEMPNLLHNFLQQSGRYQETRLKLDQRLQKLEQQQTSNKRSGFFAGVGVATLIVAVSSYFFNRYGFHVTDNIIYQALFVAGSLSFLLSYITRK